MNKAKRISKLRESSPEKIQHEDFVNTQRELVKKLEEEYMRGTVCYYDFEYE